MDDDPLAGILGNNGELDEGAYRPTKTYPRYEGSATDPEIQAPDLLAACKDNDTARAQDLLADGVPPGFSDPESGWSCLHWAVYNGNPVLTRGLVRAGASNGYKKASVTLSQEGYSPNDIDNLGNTATHLAAANGHERVLDTLIRDGADVHKQNKFKNTPHDVANSAECRGLLRRAEALAAPSAVETENMHAKNLQRILEVERVLLEVVGPLEPTDAEQRRRQRQLQQQQQPGVDGGDEGQQGREGGVRDDGVTNAREGGGEVDSENDSSDNDRGKASGGTNNDDDGQQGSVASSPSAEGKGVDDRLADGETQEGVHGEGGTGPSAEGKTSSGGENTQEAMAKQGGRPEGEHAKGRATGPAEGDGGVGCGGGVDGGDDPGGDLPAEVDKIREAVAGAEALCICEDLVAAAKLRIEGLLLQHSIAQQAAKVAAAGPVLTQEIYTTLVNRLVLLLRRAEGNPRITSKLKGRAKALVDKSHAEYWLQVSAQRLLKVECAQARHLADMAKLEACIDKAEKVGAPPEWLRDCRSLLKRLTTEVEISNAIEGFPAVRLPIEVVAKDYWQPEDLGHIEETEGFPLPPVDAEGKSLDYVWVPSISLRALSSACKRMTDALTGAEGLNPNLVERGSKKLHEHQKELKLLQEKDGGDKDKAVGIATKAAKKLKKKGGGKKKKKGG